MSAKTETAKVFMSGRSQAVRLPKSCRFEAAEVQVRRVGRSVILTPVDDDRAAQVRAVFEALEQAGEPFSRPEEWPQAEREALLP